jgi:phospholipid transport system transporter-binding protein
MFSPTPSLTVSNASAALEDGARAIEAGQTEIDFTNVSTVDSAAVATLLAWRRAAQQCGRKLKFVNVPDNLQSLVVLYGVADLLQTTPQAESTIEPTASARVDLLHH